MIKKPLLALLLLLAFGCNEDELTINEIILGHWKNEIVDPGNDPDTYYSFFDAEEVETINFSTGSPRIFVNDYRIIDQKYLEYNYGTSWTRLGPIEMVNGNEEFRVLLSGDAYMTFVRVTQQEYEENRGS